LEDIIEELLQEEIIDETDVFEDVQRWVPTFFLLSYFFRLNLAFFYRQIMVNRMRRQSSSISTEAPPSPKTAARLHRQATANAQHLALSSSMPAAPRHVDDVADNSGEDENDDGDSVFPLSPPATERTRLLSMKSAHRSSKA
jgi:hypothetical protein